MTKLLALAAAVAGGALALWLAAGGGLDVTIAGVPVRLHEPLRPLFWASVALAVAVLAHGPERSAAAWRRWTSGVNRAAAAAALAAGTTALGVAYATTTGNTSDQYGYVSQANLWIGGAVKIPQPWVAQVPWPDAAWTFAPLGYRPIPAESAGTIAPAYPPGLPLLMAAAKRAAGHAAMFWVVPLSGGALVLLTFGLGRRLASPGIGLVASWLVATSPTVLFMAMQPMSDVPVAAACAAAFFFLLGPGASSAAAAGFFAGVAALIRPNVAPMAGLLAGWYGLAAWRAHGRDRSSRARQLGAFVLGLLPGVLAMAAINRTLYGSAFETGLGDVWSYFSRASLVLNLDNYARWFTETQTWFALAGVVAVLAPLRLFWPSVTQRSFLPVAALFVLGMIAQYGFFLVFDNWTFLRFFLPCWPLVMIGVASTAAYISQSRRAFVALVVTWLMLWMGAYGLRQAATRGTFDLWTWHRRAAGAAQLARSLTGEAAVILTKDHSGSTRYYGGRMTLRFDLLDPRWLDRAIAWMSDHGAHPYALLEQAEIDELKRRFPGQRAADRLDSSLIAVYEGSATARPTYLYDLAPIAATRAPVHATIDPATLRNAPPAEPPRFGFSKRP